MNVFQDRRSETVSVLRFCWIPGVETTKTPVSIQTLTSCVSLPEGDVVEVLGELGQVRTLLLILLLRPQQHLWKLDR